MANLWDVTDSKDIDRFSKAVLEEWVPGDGAAPEPARRRGAAPPALLPTQCPQQEPCRLPHLIVQHLSAMGCHAIRLQEGTA